MGSRGKDGEKQQLLLGWLGCGEVYCGQGLRTGAKSGTSSPGHSLEFGGMGWEGTGASWVAARLGQAELPTAAVPVPFPSAGDSRRRELEVGHTHTQCTQ